MGLDTTATTVTTLDLTSDLIMRLISVATGTIMDDCGIYISGCPKFICCFPGALAQNSERRAAVTYVLCHLSFPFNPTRNTRFPNTFLAVVFFYYSATSENSLHSSSLYIQENNDINATSGGGYHQNYFYIVGKSSSNGI